MSFKNRTEFITAQASEKLTLAHVEARARLFEWVSEGGGVYSKAVPYFVVSLKKDQEVMVKHTGVAGLNEGMFYYDTLEGKLYAHFMGSVNPTTIQAIVTYRFFYATGPCVASWDLTDTGEHVQYDGRIMTTPGYNTRVGIDQSLTSVIGSGTLKLENGDGGLDQVFDTLYFENRFVTLYSWNRDLDFSEARVLYRGRITNKRFGPNDVSFLIKDTIYDLEQAIPLDPYTSADNVNSNIIGKYKRQVYGRVDGLKLQSVDQIGDGYLITGTVAASAASATLTGTGTAFLSETSPGDQITIGTQEFTIEAVVSDTEITLDSDTTFAFSGATAILLPEIPTVIKNREFFVTGHACSNLQYVIVNILQLNRIVLSSTVGLEAGDFIEFQATNERKEIKNTAPGNIVVLQSSITTEPGIGTTILRQPIQRLYRGESTINADNFTVSNLGAPTNECKVTLNDTVEFDLARNITLGFDLAFTNGLRTVTTPDAVDLRETLSPRDWIRPADLSYTVFYEILSVDETQLELRVAFADSTITDEVTARLPDYIGDDSIISAEVIGKTVNGEPSGVWIQTAPQAVRDILSAIEVDASLVNETSFTDAVTDAPQVLSLSLPTSETGGAVKAKTAIDLINQTVGGSLTLDNDLKLQYRVLQADTPDDPVQVHDEHLIKWNINTSSGKNFRDTVVRYRHTDVDRASLERGTAVQTFSSDFIRDYIETSQLKEFDAYLFKQNEAAIFAERQVYYNRLSQSTITLQTDLRFENVEIGDVMQMEMIRLYARLGGDGSRKKIAVVVGKKITGDSVEIILSDLGNLFNSSAVIAPNTTPEFASATEDEKLKYGFITDSQGIVDDDETTANINLIS